MIKKKDLQNNICHKVAPSKDLTINPPKLKLVAPKKINKGPGRFFIIFIYHSSSIVLGGLEVTSYTTLLIPFILLIILLETFCIKFFEKLK